MLLLLEQVFTLINKIKKMTLLSLGTNSIRWIGLSGISAARFYMDIHPECRLAILEEDVVVGGVWSSSMFIDF